MSTLTYLTSLVQQAISRLNNYEANAKKVDELPHQTTLEPSSKIPVSRGGISEHVTVQQIISSIQNSNYNQLLAVGTITVDGTDIIIPSGVSGQINGALYGTSTDTTIPITLCPAGFTRKYILVLTTSNTVVVISGEETDGAIVLAPPTPPDTVYITEFDVNDTSVGTPIDPSLGTQFKKKSESAAYNDPTLSGSNAVIALQPNGQSVYAFSNAGLVSIDGFGLDLITGNPSAEVPYPGKDILIYNNKAGNLTLKHDGSGTADVKFLLEGGVDLIIPSGGKVWLKYGPSYCEMIFKSWIDVDLSTKADLVGGKVPSSQLPSYVDDVLEFANLSAFPAIGESGKIYLALDTNFTYRWSGSAYVQIGGGVIKEKLTNLIDDYNNFILSNYTTNGNANWEIENGKIKSSGVGSYDFNSYILNNSITNVEDFIVEMDFYISTPRNATSYGIALLVKSISDYFKYSFYILLDTSSTGSTAGKMNVYSNDGSGTNTVLHTSSQIIPINPNDKLRYTIKRSKDKYTFISENLTQNKRCSWYFKSSLLPSYPTTGIVNNICKIGVSRQDIIGTDIFYIEKLKVKRNTFKNIDFLFVGDSITFGYETGININERYANLIFSNNKSNKSFEVYAQPGNGSSDLLKLSSEILSINPKNLILNIGMNDAQMDKTSSLFISNLNSFVNSLNGSGINIIFLLIKPYTPKINLITEYNELIETTFGSTHTIIDTFRPLIKSANSNLHPSNDEHNLMAQIIENKIYNLL